MRKQNDSEFLEYVSSSVANHRRAVRLGGRDANEEREAIEKTIKIMTRERLSRPAILNEIDELLDDVQSL